MPWGESIALVTELQIEPGSHLAAALAGWSWPASMSEIAQLSLLEAFLRSKAEKPDRIHVPMPWHRDEKAEAEKVTAEERAELRDFLAANSAFRDQ